MSAETKNRRPFGIEYLERLQVPTRGTDTVTGPNDGCCRTYASEYMIVKTWQSEEDTPSGGAFCDDTDLCVTA